MRHWHGPTRSWCVLLCAAQLAVCPTLAAATPPQAEISPAAQSTSAPVIAEVGDIELAPDGTLQGFVVDIQGVPIAGAEIVVQQGSDGMAQALTDNKGAFAVKGLRPGTCQVRSGRYGQMFRAWSPRTAPPESKAFALVVVGQDVVRGQMPLEDFFASDAFVVTAAVGAMVAVPITAHAMDDDEPVSP